MVMKPEPITDGQLFDTIHELFGIGDWNPDDQKQWHQVRVAEIAKIKAIRTSRHYTIPELAGLARYVHDRRYTVEKVWDLLPYWREYRRMVRENERQRVNEDFDAALEVERGRPDGQEWVGRLLRAQGPGRAVVLAQWREERT